MPLSVKQKEKREKLIKDVRDRYKELIAKGETKSNAEVAVAHWKKVSSTTVRNYLKEKEKK